MTTDEREATVVAAVLSLAGARGPDGTSPAGRLAGLACELLGVPAAGVLLAEAPDPPPGPGPPAGGGTALVAASATDPALNDVLIMGTESGPGIDCVRGGRPVSGEDLTRERHRWLRFTAKATAAGVRAAFALPLRRGDDVAGALLLLHHDTGPLPAGLRRLGQSLADAAALGILHEWEVRHAERVAEQLRGALHSRIVIEQAKGAIALHAGMDPEQAFVVLRGHARRRGRILADLAGDVVAGRADPSSIVRGE